MFDFLDSLTAALHSAASALPSHLQTFSSISLPDHSGFLFISTVSSDSATNLVLTQSASSSSDFLEPNHASQPIKPKDHSADVESALAKSMRRLSLLCLAADAVLIGASVYSWGLPCDAHLTTWAAGALALSFPASFTVDCLAKNGTRRWFRRAFVLESGLLIVSFGWLCYGFVLMGGGHACVDTAPLLWWSSFVEACLGMSVTGTGIFCMISATVLSVIYGVGE